MREFEPIGHHGSAYANSFSAEQNSQFTQQFNALTQMFKSAQVGGLSAGSTEVQALAKEHFDFCSQF